MLLQRVNYTSFLPSSLTSACPCLNTITPLYYPCSHYFIDPVDDDYDDDVHLWCSAPVHTKWLHTRTDLIAVTRADPDSILFQGRGRDGSAVGVYLSCHFWSMVCINIIFQVISQRVEVGGKVSPNRKCGKFTGHEIDMRRRWMRGRKEGSLNEIIYWNVLMKEVNLVLRLVILQKRISYYRVTRTWRTYVSTKENGVEK